ncbi:hypothetical protein D3C78_872150 [compost metagenome]
MRYLLWLANAWAELLRPSPMLVIYPISQTQMPDWLLLPCRKLSRENLRQEPCAVMLHVRICKGAVGNHHPYRTLYCCTCAPATIPHGVEDDYSTGVSTSCPEK